MGTLLPRRGERATPTGDPEVLDLATEDADEAFAALSSKTARKVLARLYEEPATPVEIREAIGTSLQNVHYHVEKLESAGLIESAGTDYSAKGNEMTVYAPTSEALVLVAGDDEDRSLLKRTIGSLLAGVGLLAAGALVFGRLVPNATEPAAKLDAEGGVGIQSEAGDATATATDAVLADPALAFFLGGAFVLVLLVGYWYYGQR